MLSSILASSIFISVTLGLAIPNGSPPQTCYNLKSVIANFDDLTSAPGVDLTPIPTPYKGLLYQGFDLDVGLNLNAGVQPGVVPHSPTNYALSDSRTTTTAGSAELTTNYANSIVKTVNLKSFYYGCVLDLQNGAAGVPTACNIAVTGFARGDNTNENVQVAAQEFSYNPTTNTGAQQQAQGIFNSQFQNLQYVLFQYTLPGGLAGANPVLGLLIDDVAYTYCS